MRKLILLATLVVLGALASATYADDEGYIQINNGNIVTNRGQQFQIVAQFGNRGQDAIFFAWVECYAYDDLGTMGNIYSQFPMKYKTSDEETGVNIAGGYYIGLPRGQNYNFSVDVRVKNDAVQESTVWCNLWGFDGTTWYWLDDAYADVRING